MSKMSSITILLVFISVQWQMNGQTSLEFDGQVSVFANYSPDNDFDMFAGGRYLPELDYHLKLDSLRSFDIQISGNLYGSTNFRPFYKENSRGGLDLYRVWARYTSKQLELRLGLQKIDFGSATLLRPLQWFNQIDPRDPLALTNGVFGLLGKYYFPNNANIWIWGLYANNKTRGFDTSKTAKNHPEFGGRVQYPIAKGEIALSYHYRRTALSTLPNTFAFDETPENRMGLDAKWDLGIGLWFEATHTHKTENVGMFTNQSLLNLGTDYTFGIGNGLHLVTEHLLATFDERTFGFTNKTHFTALNMSYPLGLFNTINTIGYYNWTDRQTTFFINYQHQFSKLTGYLMAYYNPEVQRGLQQNELLNIFSGPGVRFMLVYNH